MYRGKKEKFIHILGARFVWRSAGISMMLLDFNCLGGRLKHFTAGLMRSYWRVSNSMINVVPYSNNKRRLFFLLFHYYRLSVLVRWFVGQRSIYSSVICTVQIQLTSLLVWPTSSTVYLARVLYPRVLHTAGTPLIPPKIKLPKRRARRENLSKPEIMH